MRKTERAISVAMIIALFMTMIAWNPQRVAAATLINYSNFASTTGLSLVGTAAVAGTAIRLTDSGGFEEGAFWSQQQVSTAAAFSSSFNVSLLPGNSRGDGFAFVIQTNGANDRAIGTCAKEYFAACFSPNVGVEFDIHQNAYDPNDNHVGVFVNGDVTTETSVATPTFDLVGTPFTVWVDYDLQTLRVYVARSQTKPAQPLLATSIDIGATLGRGVPATVGFTGATGLFTAVQDIQSWQLSGTAGTETSPPPAPAGPCLAGAALKTDSYPIFPTLTYTDRASSWVDVEYSYTFQLSGGKCPEAILTLTPGAEPSVALKSTTGTLTVKKNGSIDYGLPYSKNTTINSGIKLPDTYYMKSVVSNAVTANDFYVKESASNQAAIKLRPKPRLLRPISVAAGVVAILRASGEVVYNGAKGVTAPVRALIKAMREDSAETCTSPLGCTLLVAADPSAPLRSAISASAPPDVLADLSAMFGADFVAASAVGTLDTAGGEKVAGQWVAFSGSGFTPGGPVTVVLSRPADSDSAAGVEVRADDQGRIAGQVQVPSGAVSGRWNLAALDTASMDQQVQALIDGTSDAPHFVLSAASVNVTGIAAAPSFADVPADYWAHDQIITFAQRGITTGCGDDDQGRRLYCPERGVTRAEMATFITRTLGQDKIAPPATPTFADVPTDYWAYGQIEAFAKLGITTGCGLNDLGQRIFCPDRGVTRAEMAVFIDRAKGQAELPAGTPTFADVPANYWAYGWIERFFTLGVTTGCGTDDSGKKVYCPDRGVTRAEMAVFIIRAYP